MVRTTDRGGADRTGAGGAPPLPPDLDALPVDEGPMRGELMRQIEALEATLARFITENCPYEELPVMAQRGPVVLTTEQLEYVRDELLAVQRALHDRVVTRMAEGLSSPDPEPEVVGLFERLRRRLRSVPGR